MMATSVIIFPYKVNLPNGIILGAVKQLFFEEDANEGGLHIRDNMLSGGISWTDLRGFLEAGVGDTYGTYAYFGMDNELDISGKFVFQAPIVVASYTFAEVGTDITAPAVGMLILITDSNTAVWGDTIAGGGANTVLAFYNGANWTVAGK